MMKYSKHVICLWALVLTTSISAHAESLTKFLMIDGTPTELVLTPKSMARFGLTDNHLGNQHFDVTLVDNPEFGGRAAFIDGKWQGLLVLEGQIHLIEALADSKVALASNENFSSKAFSAEDTIGSCGIQSKPSSSLSAKFETEQVTVASLLTAESQISYNQFCQSTVDGICLVAELTVVFDTAFEDKFGASYQSQGAAILDYVDYIYENNFNIRFNHIHLGFGDGDNLSASNDIEVVLEDLTQKRIDTDTVAYDPNPRSLFHFITGRDYAAFNDDVIGLAWISGYGNYPNEVDPALCTPFASATSQAFGANSTAASFTALIVAHEIGHNFGFDHDGEIDSYAEQCDGERYIMAPSIRSGVTEFSACSHEAIAPNIGALNPIENCFDFPVDISYEVEASSSIPSLNSFTESINLVWDKVHTGTHVISSTGSIAGSGASFSQVTLAGNACSLSNGNLDYDCSASTSSRNNTLAMTITPGTGDMVITHDASFTNNGALYETDTTNNDASHTIIAPQSGLAPEDLSASLSGSAVVLTWADRSSDEVNFIVERRDSSTDWQIINSDIAPNTQTYTDNGLNEVTQYEYRVSALFADSSQAASNTVAITTGRTPRNPVSSSGGGGSLNWLWLTTLIPLWVRRRKAICDRPHT